MTYTSHWDDSYITAGEEKRTGPEFTLNHYTDPEGTKRIDFIFHRGDNIILEHYTCDNTLYDGLYASDHFPIYIDVVIQK